MKILVTGASGFLGKSVVNALRLCAFDVIATDKVGGCEFIGDLINPIFIRQLPDVDVVVHCAAVQYVTKKKPIICLQKYFYENNVVATGNLIRHYRGRCKHFISIGTSMQYRQNGASIYDEQSEMGSQGVYSWSKLLAQKIVDESEMRTSTIIPCIIGGIGREGLFDGFVSTIRKFSLAIIPGEGREKISIVHVDDVARLVVQIVKTGAVGKYNAAATDVMSISEWAQLIGKILNKKKVFIVRLPLWMFSFFSKITCYRIIAREQLIMLKMPHVLDTRKAMSIGAESVKSCSIIIEDITKFLVRND